ncbi:kinesin-like protein KIF20B [Phymastichus coffea]|uniref:kinesin-like protein KIF20B n=1 Tax=Phymastichus coffea TaxID=108790 RepID=UPI00273C3DD9|nr:kinesin-like protein KIF20B [Phymastichus coffea]
MSRHEGQREADCCRAHPEKPASAESSTAAAPSSKTKVVLRIRPASPPDENKTQPDIYVVDSPVSLLVRRLTADDSARRSKPSESVAFKKFSFDRIFEPQVDQARLFGEAVEPRLAGFLHDNENCSVVSYGSVDAGKTYTLFGPSSDPGIVPRSIACVFSSIDCAARPRYKPQQHSQGVVRLDEAGRDAERDARQRLVSCRAAADGPGPDEWWCAALQDCPWGRDREPAKGRVCSLWISFIEIYNDAVYDLLEVDEDGKNMPLKLSTDKHGLTYVQGMRSVCATTGLEAYGILNAGQTRLSTVSASNYKSSRSHSIFTMRLLKYEKDSTPAAVQTSTISFYDLAGTGKLPKSASSDKQLKESRSISTSLLAFGRCLKALAEGHSRQSTGPFRDSKLTRLFEHSLRKENLIILINLNPSFELFAETQNALNFALTAVKLTTEFAKEDKRLLDYQSPVSSPKLQRMPSPIPTQTLSDQEINEILTKNKQLLDQIKQLKSAELTREYKLRQDLADFYTKQLTDLEDIWKNRMSLAEEQKEYLLKLSVDRLDSRYKSRLGEQLDRRGKTSDNLSIEKLNEDSAKVSKLEELLESAKEENEQYAIEVSWLKAHFKRIADFIGCTKKYDDDLPVDELSTTNFQYLNNDTISHVQSIVDFVRASCANEQADKTVQCDLDATLLDQYSKSIEALFHSNDISLAAITDSSGLSNERLDKNAQSQGDPRAGGLVERLSRIEQCVADCLSHRRALEVENHAKEEQLRVLRRTTEQQDIDLLRARQQHSESESARLLLLRKCESLEMASKSREFFKNPDFDADDPENSLSCSFHQEVVSLKETDDTYLTSVPDSSSLNNESNATRSRSDASKDDSGIAFSLDSVVGVRRQQKYCQTDGQWNEDQHEILQSKLMQLNLDYNRMEAQRTQGSKRITELSLELERIREAMLQLKADTTKKDRTISECQTNLRDSKAEIDRLNEEKRQLENQLNELRNNLLAVSKDYERKLDDSQLKVRAYEAGECRYLKDYWEKSVNLGFELSMAYSELEKFSLRCYKEHVLKIHKLEEELSEKTVSLAKLNEQMRAYERDLAQTIALSGKVDECESVLNQLQRHKVNVDSMIADRTEAQLIIRDQLDYLTQRIGERDDQVSWLKWQLKAIIKANSSNSLQANILGRQVTKLIEKLTAMREDIAESETARTDLERKSAKEIDNLRARLTIFEGNVNLLSLIRNSDESTQCEIDKLKLKVLEKEKELEFFKKNRNATIRRYECLVKQLQQSLKMNEHSGRPKKMFFNQSYRSNVSKDTTCWCVRGADSQRYDWQEVRDQTKSVVHLSRKDVETKSNGSFESRIEEGRCGATTCSGQEVEGRI